MKILLIIIYLIFSVQTCDTQCDTCLNDSPYSCTSCSSNPTKNLFIKSCQAIQSSTLFLGIAILIIVLHLMMLLLGNGVYRNFFENIQLISLISWGYGSQNGIQQLQITNFGKLNNNKFLASYGTQFLISITVISIFIVLVSAVDRLPHNTIATLIKRKRIIFPFRIQGLLFNMICFSALSQVCTFGNNQKSPDIFQVIISIIALIKQFSVLMVIFYITNFKNFQIDDQYYYILVQKLSTCRWYARNNLFLGLSVRALIIVVFVTLFEQSDKTGIVITIIMLIFTVISALSLRYVKIRYSLFNFIGNNLTTACLFCMYGCGSQIIGSQKWQQYKKAYYILAVVLCSTFLLANLIEMIANSSIITKQVKSMYFRFIICQKMDEAVQLNKYDSNRHRENVTTFRANLIYNNRWMSQEKEVQFSYYRNV